MYFLIFITYILLFLSNHTCYILYTCYNICLSLCSWKQKKLSHGLLILDDVCCYEIIKYLDIGCKILITTHDRSIMDEIVDSRINYVKVNEGFEEKETLNLFSKCLNVDCTLLPSYASKLHKICKGNKII